MTTTEITWGDPIDAANDGKPLPWLKADEGVLCKWGTIEGWCGPYSVSIVSGWGEGFQIKLPADHPYYLATSHGFTYWPGGDRAPDDWDCGEVILDDETIEELDYPDLGRGHHIIPIIGYRKRAEPAEDSGDYVRVKRMTLAEYDGSVAWARRVGIIREETPLEQFEREFGALNHESRHAVKAFIAWQNDHG